MGYNSYEKHYLFKQGTECCSKFFPSATNCPYENTAQTGYYWEKYQDSIPNTAPMPFIYNHTYYPAFESGTCVNGYASATTGIKRFSQHHFSHLHHRCISLSHLGPTILSGWPQIKTSSVSIFSRIQKAAVKSGSTQMWATV